MRISYNLFVFMCCSGIVHSILGDRGSCGNSWHGSETVDLGSNLNSSSDIHGLAFEELAIGAERLREGVVETLGLVSLFLKGLEHLVVERDLFGLGFSLAFGSGQTNHDTANILHASVGIDVSINVSVEVGIGVTFALGVGAELSELIVGEVEIVGFELNSVGDDAHEGSSEKDDLHFLVFVEFNFD